MIPVRTLPLRKLVCARCQAPFECGGGGTGGGCWCMDEAVRIPMPETAGDDCLCPTCLRGLAAGALPE